MNTKMCAGICAVILTAASCSGDAERLPAGSGTIEAVEITVSSLASGTVMERFVEDGDNVGG